MPKIKNIQADQSLSNNDKLLGSDSGGGTRNYTFASITDFLRATNAAGVADQITFKYDTSIGQASGYLDAPSQTNFETNATRTIRISVFSFNDPSNTKADFIQSLLNKNIIISNVDNQNNFGVFTITNISTDGDFKTLTLSVPIAAKGSITSGEIYAIAPSAIGASNLTQVQSTTTNQLTITNGTGPTASLAIVTGAVSDNGNGLSTQAQIKSYVDSQITAQDLDFQGDTGGALSIDLDSETLSIVGTSNEIETAGSGNQIQIGLPDSIVVTTVSNTNQTTTGNLKVDDSGLFTIGANADLRIFHTNNGDIEFQKQGLNKDLTFSISSSSDASVMTELMRFDHSSQNVIFSRPIQLDSVNISAVQTASESFADNDTSIMTSAAIDDRINAAVATKDNTDEITEGSSNLYFTNERVDDRVNALLQAGSNVSLSYDDAANTLTISSTQLTNEQVQDVIGGMLGGDETGGISVTYDDTNNEIDFALSSIPNSSLTNSSVTVNGTSIALGASGTLDTGDIGEGSNLYFTNERVDDRVNALLQAGSNVSLTYDDVANTLTIAATQLTNEQVQDIIGGMLGGDETGGISVTYDDNNNEIDFTISNVPNSSLANSSVTINGTAVSLGGSITLDTNDIGEGSDNLYYTDARVQAVSINNVVEDTTPQLGGTLDTNGNLIQFGDSGSGTDDRLQFGASQDLEIYHDGSHSYITDTGTGNLIVSGSARVELKSANDKYFFRGVVNSGVDLYFNDSIKLTTTTGGIDVTGNIVVSGTVDGVDIAARDAVLTSTTTTANAALPKAGGTMTGDLILGDDVKIELGDASGGDLQIYHDGSHSYIENDTGNFYIKNRADDADIIFQSDDGSGGVATYYTIDGGNEANLFSKNVKLSDSVELRIGSSNDLKILHNGTNSFIQNFTGTLQIQNQSDDKDILLRSDDGSGGIATYFYLDGSTVLNRFPVHARWDDSIEAQFGAGADLKIYHDGSHSYIKDTGTGRLRLQASTQIDFLNGAGTETLANFIEDGAVKLYYDNNLKFETTNTGVTVTGTLSTSGGGISLNGGNFTMGDKDGSISGAIMLGNSSDLQIYHDGSHSYIADAGTGELRLSADVFRVLNANASETMIYAAQDGKVQLRFNESTKFETTNTGVSITGTATATTFSGDLNGTINTVTTATTQSASDNSTKVATTAYVDTAVTNLVDSSPAALDTLNELAAALGDDANFSTTVTNSIATKVAKAGDTMTGALTVNLSSEGTYFTGGSGGVRQLSITSGTNTSAHALHTFNIASTNGKYEFEINSTPQLTLDSSSATFAGDVSLTAGALSITADGSNATSLSESDAGNFLIDTVGNITLDADSGNIMLKDGASEFGRFSNDSQSLIIQNVTADKDIIFKGKDGSSNVTALTLDMSNGGNATFAGAVTVGTGTVAAANAAADDFVITGPGTTATGMTISNTSDSGTGTIFFGDTSDSAAAGFRYNHNTGDMAISAEDNVTFTCDNVGIGTTSPNRKLEVSSGGSDVPQIRAAYDTNNYIDIKHDIINKVGGSSLTLQTAGSSALTLDTSQDATFAGDVTLANGKALRWTSDDVRIEGTTVSDNIKFYVGGTEILQLHQSNGATFAGNIRTGGTAITANANFDNLVIEGTSHTGISIISGSTGTDSDGGIYFGDQAANNLGQIKYLHASNSMTFATNDGSASLTLDSGLNATFAGDVEIHKSGNDTTGKLTISGNNNTGTPGQKTSGTIEHRGEHLKTVITHNGSDVITIGTGTQTTFEGNVTIEKSTPVLTFNNTAGGGLDPSLTATGTNFTISTSSITPFSLALGDGTLTLDPGQAGKKPLKLVGNYSSSGDVKILEFVRVGDAVAGAIEYNDATTDMEIGTVTNHAFSIKTNDTRALTINNSQNATFAGNITAAFDSNNSGNRLRIADTEGTSAAVRTYSTSDGTGLILNHYYAVSGSPYMRYSDFVSNMGDAAATTMRFLTKPHNGNPTVALTIDNSQKATFAGDISLTQADTPTIELKDTTNNQFLLIRHNNSAAFFDVHSSSHYEFQINSSEKMRLDNNGNFALGTTNATPSNGGGMCINGGSITRIDFRNSTTGDTTGDGTSLQLNGNNFTIENRESGYVAFSTSLTERARITSAGYLNLGSGSLTQSAYQLRVDADADNGVYISAGSSSSNHSFYVENAAGSAELLAVRGDGEVRLVASGTGNVLIGTSSHQSGTKLQVAGVMDVWSSTNTLLRFQHDGTRGIIQTFTSGAYSNTAINPNGGNVGIGTDSPTELLTLNKASGAVGILLEGDGTDVGKFKVASAGVNHALQIGTISNNEVQFHTNNGEKMRIHQDGNVGIGTTSPDYLLHLERTGNIMAQLKATDSNQAYMKFVNSTTGDGAFTDGLLFGLDTDESAVFWNYEATPIRFATSGTERARLDSSGRLGIGMTPSDYSGYMLQISGTTQAFMSFGNSTTGTGALNGLIIGNDATGADIYQREAQPIRISTNNIERMRIDSSGNLGLGTTTPDAILETSSSATGNAVGALLTNTNGSGTADSASLNFGLGRSADSLIFSIPAIKLLKEQQWTGTASTVDASLVFSTVSDETTAERMRIESDGTVQITNSTSPKLQLKRGTKEYTSRVDNANKFVIQEEGGNEFFIVESGASSNSIRVDSSGQVGVGTSAPERPLHVLSSIDNPLLVDSSDDTTGIIFRDNNASNSIFYRGNGDYFYTNSQKLGIGTGSPSSQLHLYRNDTSTNELLIENDGTGDAALSFRSDNNTDGNNFSSIYFDANDEGNNNTRYAKIRAFIEDNAAGAEDGKLVFTTLTGASDVNQLILDSSGATFAGDVTVDSEHIVHKGSSPEFYFHTTGNHCNWLIAAQESSNATLEFSAVAASTSLDTDASNYTPILKLGQGGGAIFAGDIELDENLTFTTNNFVDIANTGTGAMRFKPSSSTLALTLTGANATFAGDVFTPGLYVNATSAVAGTQVAIVKDGDQNLQRWGSTSDGGSQHSYRFRIDQNFKFIGNSGGGDQITIHSNTGNIDTSGSITLAATKKLFLDGGGNTYIQEVAGDDIDIVAGGNQSIEIRGINTNFGGDVTLAGTKSLITNSILTASGDLDIKTVLTSRDIRIYDGNNNVTARIKGDGTGATFAGTLGIGITSPDAPLHIAAASSANNAEIIRLAYTDGTKDQYRLQLKQSVTSGVVRYNFCMVNNNSASDNMLIFDRGSVYINPSSPTITLNSASTSGTGIRFPGGANDSGVMVSVSDEATPNIAIVKHSDGSTADREFIRFVTEGSTSGEIVTGGSTSVCSYNSASDYRLKEDLKDFDGLALATKIKMYDFKWKENDTRGYGVLAHELQEVVPTAVTRNKDEEEMQGVDYSKLVPVLLKSIQELEARVKELENK